MIVFLQVILIFKTLKDNGLKNYIIKRCKEKAFPLDVYAINGFEMPYSNLITPTTRAMPVMSDTGMSKGG